MFLWQQVEESLQGQMKKKLEEKDKHLEEELLNQQENLQQIISQKEQEQKTLQEQLQDAKTQSEKKEYDLDMVKAAVMGDLEDVMESELQCAICSELFIQVGLACC